MQFPGTSTRLTLWSRFYGRVQIWWVHNHWRFKPRQHRELHRDIAARDFGSSCPWCGREFEGSP